MSCSLLVSDELGESTFACVFPFHIPGAELREMRWRILSPVVPSGGHHTGRGDPWGLPACPALGRVGNAAPGTRTGLTATAAGRREQRLWFGKPGAAPGLWDPALGSGRAEAPWLGTEGSVEPFHCLPPEPAPRTET